MDITYRDIVNRIASTTGIKKKDIDKVLRGNSEAINYFLRSGYSIKLLKDFKLQPIYRKERKRVYDGIHQKYYDSPAHYTLAITPLSNIKNAIERLNGN